MKVINTVEAISTRADPRHFTGTVWRSEYLGRQRDNGIRGHCFVYEPGARSHWHLHNGEQVIIVSEGRGLARWRERERPCRLTIGQWLYVEPGISHWHGAESDSVFVHLTLTASGDVEWLGPVNADEYGRDPA